MSHDVVGPRQLNRRLRLGVLPRQRLIKIRFGFRLAIGNQFRADLHGGLVQPATGNLDTANGEEVLDLLNQLNDDGTTIVMVTHDQGHADHASRVVHMLDGRVLAENIVEMQRVSEARHA